MRLSDEALKEFETLWRQDNPDEEIDKERLREIATRVMHAVELTYKPITQEKLERLEKQYGRT